MVENAELKPVKKPIFIRMLRSWNRTGCVYSRVYKGQIIEVDRILENGHAYHRAAYEAWKIPPEDEKGNKLFEVVDTTKKGWWRP